MDGSPVAGSLVDDESKVPPLLASLVPLEEGVPVEKEPDIIPVQPLITHTPSLQSLPSPSAWRTVCLLEVVSILWIPLCPWTRTHQVTSSGSGFVITGRRILTNAHLVANAIDIRVRPHGSAKRYLAKVTTYGPDVDLAVVEIEQSVAEDFWTNMADAPPIELSDSLPALQETVQALGFPAGGRTICVTEGVVSRVDSIELTPPADSTLVVQIDAAINPGNSGGPVFDARGRITGVAFCKDVRGSTDNIGYVIPAEVVKSFLSRCGGEDGYILSPSMPYRWHKLENQSLRRAHQVPDGVCGILVTSVAPAISSALHEGDVLTRIDGRPISDDGQIQLRGSELIQHRYLVRNKRIGEPTVFTVFRNKVEEDRPAVELRDLPPICPRWLDVDYLPEYLILGALALVPLAQNHLLWYKECPSELRATINRWNKRWPGERDGKDQLVLLVTVFAHELTFGYRRGWRIVETYNGTPITSLRHLRELWRATRDEVTKLRSSREGTEAPPMKSSGIFVRLGLQSDEDIVLDAAAAMDAEKGVLKTHAIERPSFIRGDDDA
mmetsp:Transcript_15979/g.46248  ORF Transcript_15979/g.46248 Transcript_15979/m.46248 type:complete len:553 (-) Transcript_15979:155-1813(-)